MGKLENMLAQRRYREKKREAMGEDEYKKAESMARKGRRSNSPTKIKADKKRMEGILKSKVESITRLEREAKGIQGNVNIIKKDIAKYGERGFVDRLRKEQARLDEKMKEVESGRGDREGFEMKIADLEAKLVQPEVSSSNVTMSLTQTEDALEALGEDVLDMEEGDIFEFIEDFERESQRQLVEALKSGLKDEPKKAPDDLFTVMDKMLETADERLTEAQMTGADLSEKKSTLDETSDDELDITEMKRELETVVEEVEESKEELVEEEAREPKRTNTDSTLKQRDRIIKKIAKDVGADTSDLSWLYGDDVMNYLESKYKNSNTKRTYYSQIVRYLEEEGGDRAEIEKYNKLMYGYIDEVKHTRMENVKSEADEAQMFDWNDLKLAKKDRPRNPLDNVVYQLYTAIPPRRNEYATLKLVKYKSPKQLSGLTEGNWLVTTGSGMNIKTIILNDYKTAKSYGQYKITPPLPLKDAFKTYFEKHAVKEGELVFPNYDTSSKWTGLVKSVFGSATGKEAGVNSIRKSFVNWKEKSGRLSQAKRQEFASAMGTSLSEWHTDYVKL